MSVYTDNGYVDRNDYLECLAEDNGVPFYVVKSLAALLGPSEDFDGLVCAVEDAAFENDYCDDWVVLYRQSGQGKSSCGPQLLLRID